MFMLNVVIEGWASFQGRISGDLIKIWPLNPKSGTYLITIWGNQQPQWAVELALDSLVLCNQLRMGICIKCCMCVYIYFVVFETLMEHTTVLLHFQMTCLFTVFLLSLGSCRVERSTDQVMKPVNTEALSKWVGHIPADVISEMAEIAPMLARLGYDPQANPPDYTKPAPMLSPFNSSQVRAAVASFKELLIRLPVTLCPFFPQSLKPTEVQHHT